MSKECDKPKNPANTLCRNCDTLFDSLFRLFENLYLLFLVGIFLGTAPYRKTGVKSSATIARSLGIQWHVARPQKLKKVMKAGISKMHPEKGLGLRLMELHLMRASLRKEIGIVEVGVHGRIFCRLSLDFTKFNG